MFSKKKFSEAFRSGCVTEAKVTDEQTVYGSPMTGLRPADGPANALCMSLSFGGFGEKTLSEIRLLGQELLAKHVPATLGSVRNYAVGPRGLHALVVPVEGKTTQDLFPTMNGLFDRMQKGDFGQPTLQSRFGNWAKTYLPRATA